jgi:hypothetical protein
MTYKQWATCECGQQMTPGSKCDFTHGKGKNGKSYRRIQYGKEQRYVGLSNWPPAEGEICHDCNAAVGKTHHTGCDMEECPVCHQQMLCCDCITTWEGLIPPA